VCWTGDCTKVVDGAVRHGPPANTQAAFKKIGSPRYPTRAQIKSLNQIADANLAATETLKLTNGTVQLHLPVNALFLLEVQK
jgi:hypothetical protein